jgi:hypothetical protein
MRPVSTLLLLVVIIPSAVLAQRPAAGTDSAASAGALLVSHFEKSYITLPYLTLGQDGLLFEASVAPPFFLRFPRNITLVLTPKVVLRMLTSNSLPVRTPSYMPRLTLYYHRPPTREELAGGRMHFYFLTLSHYSNGQDGPFTNPDGSLNHKDGSFSTNYVELGAHFGIRYPRFRRVGSFELSAEYHIPGLYEESEHRDYSDFRLHASQGVSWSIGGDQEDVHDEWGLSLTETYLVDDAGPAFDGFQRFTFWATLTWAPRHSGDLALFLNFYTGQDYYNIHFDETRTLLRLGLAASRGRASSAARGPF